MGGATGGATGGEERAAISHAGIAPSSVVLFVPCYVDQLRPSAGIASVEILESLGVDVDVRPQAICCGQPFANSGCADEARDSARLWMSHMRGAGTVVVPSSSCAVHLRHVGPAATVTSRRVM